MVPAVLIEGEDKEWIDTKKEVLPVQLDWFRKNEYSKLNKGGAGKSITVKAPHCLILPMTYFIRRYQSHV